MIHVKDEHSYFEVERTKIWRGLTASSINLIYQKWNLVQVAKSFWLKFNKNNFCKCPFHTENTGSFKVHKWLYKYSCYWCWASWNIIEFVQKYTGKNQIQAAFYIKQVCGIKEKLEFVNTYNEFEIIPEEYDTEQIDESTYLEYYKLKAKEILENWFEEFTDRDIEQEDSWIDIDMYQFFEEWYNEVYWRSYKEVTVDIELKREKEKKKKRLDELKCINLSNINVSAEQYLEKAKEVLDIFKSCNFEFSWLDNLSEWNCWKCVLIYIKANKTFKFIFWTKIVEVTHKVDDLGKLFNILNDTNRMIDLWAGFHKGIDIEENDYSRAWWWSFYIWKGYIVISWSSWDFWKMDKRILERCFKEIWLEVIYWNNYNFNDINVNKLT